MTTKIGEEDAVVLPDESKKLKLAKEALEKTDKEKRPKLYESREATIKALEAYQSQRDRAKKAEIAAKPVKHVETETPIKPEEKDTPKKPDFSLQDIRALSDVHDDDVDSVVDWAKFKKISVAEAKKAPEIQNLLRTKKEERKTAEATSTGKGKRGSSKVSGQDLLKRFDQTGEMPESDEDMDKFVEARMTRKHSK